MGSKDNIEVTLPSGSETRVKYQNTEAILITSPPGRLISTLIKNGIPQRRLVFKDGDLISSEALNNT